jgi:hypothetical protein
MGAQAHRASKRGPSTRQAALLIVLENSGDNEPARLQVLQQQMRSAVAKSVS